MIYDFNRFARSAVKLQELGRWQDALCYEAMGRLREAKYWHGRAVEENPSVRIYSEEALRRIGGMPIEHLLITD